MIQKSFYRDSGRAVIEFTSHVLKIYSTSASKKFTTQERSARAVNFLLHEYQLRQITGTPTFLHHVEKFDFSTHLQMYTTSLLKNFTTFYGKEVG